MTSPFETSDQRPPTDDGDAIFRWARLALTALLLFLGMRAFRDEYGQVPLIGGIDLAIHEFGHMLFMPFGIEIFGETGVILGGSLTQVAIPLLFGGVFLFGPREHRDLHGAMACLWWTSINLLEVSVYAADARARQLMLISGSTGQEDDSGHDFYNLFSGWGVLEHDRLYADRIRGLALMLFFVSIVVGAWAAWQSGSRLSTLDSREPTSRADSR